MGYPFMGAGWSAMGFGWIIMLLFWALIIAGIVWSVKLLTGQSSTAKSGALEIAKERYARGEINKKQFEEIKKNIA